ncbi:MAG: winged helix-turn-helix domain-containing protein [Planctomycetes bacterium]|nr:winged helix-turn-helix domain-containing protein [Planctomycetota bacterium]
MKNASQIGENAGKVWQNLEKTGDLTVKELARKLKLDSDDVSMALGWLARENKLKLSEKNNDICVGLTDTEKMSSKHALNM